MRKTPNAQLPTLNSQFSTASSSTPSLPIRRDHKGKLLPNRHLFGKEPLRFNAKGTKIAKDREDYLALPWIAHVDAQNRRISNAGGTYCLVIVVRAIGW